MAKLKVFLKVLLDIDEVASEEIWSPICEEESAPNLIGVDAECVVLAQSQERMLGAEVQSF